jgi:pimeloyl-[acyl-carrier protein] methyl ester esterase
VRLLLLPGMDGTGRLFAPLQAALPPWLPAVTVSYPPDQPLGYDGLLPLVEAAAAGLGEFVVVGESFSGPLALMLATQRPPGLRGLVLCASFVRFPLPVPQQWRGLVRPWMFRLQPTWLVALVLLGRRGWGPLGRLLRGAVRSVSPAALAARARAVAGVDVTAELQTCPVPVLYLRAAGDLVIRPGCWELVRSVRPDAEIVVLPGPHLVLQVSPAEAAAALAEFCDRLPRPNQAQQPTNPQSRTGC